MIDHEGALITTLGMIISNSKRFCKSLVERYGSRPTVFVYSRLMFFSALLFVVDSCYCGGIYKGSS